MTSARWALRVGAILIAPLTLVVPSTAFVTSGVRAAPIASPWKPTAALGSCRFASSSTLPVDELSSPPTPSAVESFNSPSFRVYIEDTDAYGVMYNSNYLRSYERALSHVPRDDKTTPHENRNEANNTNQQWLLTVIDEQKFRSSPNLGEEYIVRGDLLELRTSDDVEEEVWRVEMVTRNEINDADVIHNSATATIARPLKQDYSSVPVMTNSIHETAQLEGTLVEHRYTPYHDEFDVHEHIPLRNAMNFFERSRTNALVGPDSLRRLQVEDDILWVVTSINTSSGKVFYDTIALESDNELVKVDGRKLDLHPVPGRELLVESNIVSRRRGMILDFYHRLYMEVESSDGETVGRRLLAQAKISIMALKGTTRRPTSDLPQWLLDKLGGDS